MFPDRNRPRRPRIPTNTDMRRLDNARIVLPLLQLQNALLVFIISVVFDPGPPLGAKVRGAAAVRSPAVRVTARSLLGNTKCSRETSGDDVCE